MEELICDPLLFDASSSTACDCSPPEMHFEKVGAEADIGFFPHSSATGITQCFTPGIATPPIRLMTTRIHPDTHWRAAPQKLASWEFELTFKIFGCQA